MTFHERMATIETAPRDETPVLLFIPDLGMVVGDFAVTWLSGPFASANGLSAITVTAPRDAFRMPLLSAAIWPDFESWQAQPSAMNRHRLAGWPARARPASSSRWSWHRYLSRGVIGLSHLTNARRRATSDRANIALAQSPFGSERIKINAPNESSNLRRRMTRSSGNIWPCKIKSARSGARITFSHYR